MSTWTPSDVSAPATPYRRGRVRRSVLVAALSTLVVGGLLTTAVTSAPGWPRVREAFFSLPDARAALPEVATGLWLNIRLSWSARSSSSRSACSSPSCGPLRGPVFWPLRALATVYVDLFTGLPLILVLLVVGLGVPGLRLQGVPTDFAILGGAALVLSYSAYVAEVLRAGIESVHPSQRAAARSLGLSAGQTPAPRRAPAGRAAGGAGPAQRLRQPAEGLGPRLDHRSGRRHRERGHLQRPAPSTHVVRRRGRAVHRSDDPDDPPDRLGVAPVGVPAHRGPPVTGAAARQPLLRVRGLRKAFGATVVLDGLDLDVDAHDVVVLIGASGSASRRCCAASTCSKPSTTA
jgi:ABC-type amino acid transport system permease subunit